MRKDRCQSAAQLLVFRKQTTIQLKDLNQPLLRNQCFDHFAVGIKWWQSARFLLLFEQEKGRQLARRATSIDLVDFGQFWIDTNIYAPEFQLVNETSSAGYINFTDPNGPLDMSAKQELKGLNLR